MSFWTGFILGWAYAGLLLWMGIGAFKRKKTAILWIAVKWPIMVLILYFLLNEVDHISFAVGFVSFLSFWLFLALESRRGHLFSHLGDK